MKRVREHINEKFVKDSDPIKDMDIGINLPKDFEPIFILKKQYPGMNWPIGTYFGTTPGWSVCCAWNPNYNKGVAQYYTGWSLDYFIPWVGTFFTKV